ncbi:UNVERIFIED_CONTAM: hypothetical protein K2H54_062177 [Gekko kuhli]
MSDEETGEVPVTTVEEVPTTTGTITTTVASGGEDGLHREKPWWDPYSWAHFSTETRESWVTTPRVRNAIWYDYLHPVESWGLDDVVK